MNQEIKTFFPENFIKLPQRPIPLISKIISLMEKEGLSPQLDYLSYISNPANQEIAKRYLLSLACREAGDQTGILGAIIGASKSGEETKTILERIGNNLLEKAGPQVLDALNGKPFDSDTALIIDDLLKKAVNSIKKVPFLSGLTCPDLNNMTLPAYNFWLRNTSELLALMRSQKTNNVFDLLRRKIEYELDPFGRRYIVDIKQAPILPQIDAQMLLEILPKELNRKINPTPPPVDTPLGFLARLNMAGSDLFRYFVQTIRSEKNNYLLQEKIGTLP